MAELVVPNRVVTQAVIDLLDTTLAFSVGDGQAPDSPSPPAALAVPPYVGEVVRMEITVFDSAELWLDLGTGEGSFTGDNAINPNLNVGKVRWTGSGATMSLNRGPGSSQQFRDTSSIFGILHGRYLHISHAGSTDVFTSNVIDENTGAGFTFLDVPFSPSVPAATTGAITTFVFASNTLLSDAPAYPYVVVYPLDVAARTGPISDGQADVNHTIQLTTVGQTAEQAAGLLDLAAIELRDMPSDAIDDRNVALVEEVSGGTIDRDDDYQPPLFYAVGIFDILTTPE